MKQRKIETVSGWLIQGSVARRAASEYGADIGLLQSNAANIGIDLIAAEEACDAHVWAKMELAVRLEKQRALFKTSREFLRLGRDMFKSELGMDYSQRWDPTGLIGSLMIPRTLGEVQSVLRSFSAFLTANPHLELASVEITARHAGELHAQLLEARLAYGFQATAVDDAMKERDAKVQVLSRRLRALFSELKLLLNPLDARWLAFGYKRPGAQATPEAPEQVEVVAVEKTTVMVAWEPTPRANYYRVWKRVIGTDEEFVPIGSPADPDFTVEDVPPNTEIEIAITAINQGGESVIGDVQTIRVAP